MMRVFYGILDHFSLRALEIRTFVVTFAAGQEGEEDGEIINI